MPRKLLWDFILFFTSSIKFFLIRGVFLVGYKVNQLLKKFNRLDNYYLVINKYSCGIFLNDGEI